MKDKVPIKDQIEWWMHEEATSDSLALAIIQAFSAFSNQDDGLLPANQSSIKEVDSIGEPGRRFWVDIPSTNL